MILRKMALHQPADEHHGQFPLAGFEDIHDMHHIAAAIGDAQRFERKRKLGAIPEIGERIFGVQRKTAVCIHHLLERVQAGGGRSPAFRLAADPADRRPRAEEAASADFLRRDAHSAGVGGIARASQCETLLASLERVQADFRECRAERQTRAGQSLAQIEIERSPSGVAPIPETGMRSARAVPRDPSQRAWRARCRHRYAIAGCVDQRIREIKSRRNSEARERGFEARAVRIAHTQDDCPFAKWPAARGLIQNAARDFFRFAFEVGAAKLRSFGRCDARPSCAVRRIRRAGQMRIGFGQRDGDGYARASASISFRSAGEKVKNPSKTICGATVSRVLACDASTARFVTRISTIAQIRARQIRSRRRDLPAESRAGASSISLATAS